MDKEWLDFFKSNFDQFKREIGEKQNKQLDLNLLERVIHRLESFSGDCEDCENYLLELSEHINKLKDKGSQLERLDYKEHRHKVREIVSHLQKKHKLVTEGYYISVYMSMGTSLGLVFGLIIFDNLALGLPIGVGIGVALGSAMDADAKKKGKTI